MNLAIIPARSGSKRIKNKNIVKINNKPIMYYALDAAKKSKIFDKIHVSTDSKNCKYCKKIRLSNRFFETKKFSR